MNVIKAGALKGTFNGFNGSGTAFEFMDGTHWRQADPTIHASHAVMPDTAIFLRRGRYYIQVDKLSDLVEVVPDI